MKKSESINNLLKAFHAAQGQFPLVKKDEDNPYFHAKYATLGAIWEAVKKPLHDNHLVVFQGTSVNGPDGMTLTTTLAHAPTGEWVESDYLVKGYKGLKDSGIVESSEPQAFGSAVTYARRYALASLLGIVISDDTDDDGEAATTHRDKPSQTSGNASGSSSKTSGSGKGHGKNPPCPECKKDKFVYEQRDEPGNFFCWKKKGGCGHTWTEGEGQGEDGGEPSDESDPGGDTSWEELEAASPKQEKMQTEEKKLPVSWDKFTAAYTVAGYTKEKAYEWANSYKVAQGINKLENFNQKDVDAMTQAFNVFIHKKKINGIIGEIEKAAEEAGWKKPKLDRWMSEAQGGSDPEKMQASDWAFILDNLKADILAEKEKVASK